MKATITKIALVFLSLTVLLMIAINTYIFIIAYSLTEARGLFEALDVVKKYRIFSNLGICSFSILLTLILLCTFLWFIIKSFVRTKKIYALEEVYV